MQRCERPHYRETLRTCVVSHHSVLHVLGPDRLRSLTVVLQLVFILFRSGDHLLWFNLKGDLEWIFFLSLFLLCSNIPLSVLAAVLYFFDCSCIVDLFLGTCL